jgi:hypothetical protein
MCDFISIGLPDKLPESLAKWRRRYFALAEHHNPTLRQALAPTHLPWLLTTGGCSCELCCRPPDTKRRADADRAVVLREDAVAIIRELATLHAGSSFLYIHFYSGDISSEQLPILSRTRRTLDSISSSAEPIMRDDLIELTNPKHPQRA